MSEFKPCPFCGGQVYMIPIELLPFQNIGDKMSLFKCKNCSARISFISDTNEQAIDAWNRRTSNT